MGSEKVVLSKSFSLEDIISTAIQIPGVRVDRDQFLMDVFVSESVNQAKIIEVGPVAAGCSREMLAHIANKLILQRTGVSSLASVALGSTFVGLPADIAQFFGAALRLAQELAYLYGAQDFWQGSELDTAAVQDQLILYCGVMFGVSGTSAGVRLLSSQLAKVTLKKLPQKALTKTLWYPIVKQIGKAIGVKVTKNSLAKGLSVAIPVVGGVISGGLNFASLLPMARRLAATFDEANFDYKEENVVEDYQEVEEFADGTQALTVEKTSILRTGLDAASSGIKTAGSNLSNLFAKAKSTVARSSSTAAPASVAAPTEEDVFVKIEKLSHLKESGILTQEEFDAKKAELLSRI